MSQFADIEAFDRNGKLALIVEVKNKRGTSTEWARRMRRNMLAHGLLPDAPFFLLALPDKFYLWQTEAAMLGADDPALEVDPTQFLRYSYHSAGISPDVATGQVFEYIVTSWLNQVLRARNSGELLPGSQDLLVETGLFEKLSGGHLELELAV